MKNLDREVWQCVTLQQLQQVLRRAASDGPDSQDPEFFTNLLSQALKDNQLERFQLILNHTPSDFPIFTYSIGRELVGADKKHFLLAIAEWHMGNPNAQIDMRLVEEAAVQCLRKTHHSDGCLEIFELFPGFGNVKTQLTRKMHAKRPFWQKDVDEEQLEHIYDHEAFKDILMDHMDGASEEDLVNTLKTAEGSSKYCSVFVRLFIHTAQREMLEQSIDVHDKTDAPPKKM